MMNFEDLLPRLNLNYKQFTQTQDHTLGIKQKRGKEKGERKEKKKGKKKED
jgi:hypothetical protein